MCDSFSISNQMIQQTINQQNIQNHIDTHNRFIQQQQDLININMLNNINPKTKRFTPVIKLADSAKAAFSKKVNPNKDTVEFNSNSKKTIPGINAPGIHRDENGMIDGIIGGRTENGDFIHVDYADNRIGGKTEDGKLWDGIRVN